MNKKEMKKNVGKHVKIRPMAARFYGIGGPELPPVDDDWIIQHADDSGITLENDHTGHSRVLGYDQIHHFMGDPVRGSGYGVLVLHVQVHIAGTSMWMEPAARPGEPLADRFEGFRGWSRENDEGYVQSLFANSFEPSPSLGTELGGYWPLVLLVVGLGCAGLAASRIVGEG